MMLAAVADIATALARERPADLALRPSRTFGLISFMSARIVAGVLDCRWTPSEAAMKRPAGGAVLCRYERREQRCPGAASSSGGRTGRGGDPRPARGGG